MEYVEVIEKLTERALDFHCVLCECGVYTENLSEDEFLQRTLDTIKKTAKNIAEGMGDPGATILGFPETLLYTISDVLYTTTWDTEDSPEELFERLRELFEKTHFRFAWRFDDEQQRLSFHIDSIKWSVACADLDQENLWINPLEFSELEPRLNEYLGSQKWTLYPVATGDQTGRFLLMSVTAVNAVKDFLLAAFPEGYQNHDPRSEWLYTGIPVSKLPSNIWEP